jgi:hypothetical protein
MLHKDVRFEVVTMVTKKSVVFWAKICRRFGETSVNFIRLYGVNKNNFGHVRSVNL